MAATANKRIDAGIKRGKRCKPVPPANHPNYGRLSNVNPDDLLSALANGMLVTELARSLGVDHAAVSRKLSKYDKDQYRQARAIGITVNLHASRELLRAAREARDPITLAGAREEFRADAWFAERELPEIYGQQLRQQVTHSVDVDLGAKLRAAEARIGSAPQLGVGVYLGADSGHPAIENNQINVLDANVVPATGITKADK